MDHSFVCNVNSKPLVVETDRAIYEVELGPIQIEITGRCNMKCVHCRASEEVPVDLPIEQIIKIMKFVRNYSPDYKEVTISGGEPLLHREFRRVLQVVRESGGAFVTLTTNGTLLNKSHLELIRDLQFERFTLSVSLDSLDPNEHDNFRRHRGAYSQAIRAIKLIAETNLPHVVKSVRTTLRPYQIKEMEEIAEFVYGIGFDRISFASVIPAGRAKHQPELWMEKSEKKLFLQKIYALKKYYGDKFLVTTSDPLRCLIRGYSDVGKDDSELVFDGCVAGTVSFNISSNGDMTPCPLLNIKMMNILELSIEEIAENYKNSDIVKNMLDMNLKGKCGQCSLKYQCGGCRARALVRLGDYLEEDPDCWIDPVTFNSMSTDNIG